MNEFQSQILTKLDTIIQIQIFSVLKDFKTNKDKIIFLSSRGYKPGEIHKITNIPMQTIYNATSKGKKKIDIKEGELDE